MADFIVSDQGTIVSFMPVSQAAKDWVADSVHLEDWQWLGAAFAVDHRFAGQLLDGIGNAGFEVDAS